LRAAAERVIVSQTGDVVMESGRRRWWRVAGLILVCIGIGVAVGIDSTYRAYDVLVAYALTLMAGLLGLAMSIFTRTRRVGRPLVIAAVTLMVSIVTTLRLVQG
jgi:1,4-dihydroxy-2-naphthoate octaprenyltransferase